MFTANKNSKTAFGLLFLTLFIALLVVFQQLVYIWGRAQKATTMITELQVKLKKSEEKLERLDRRNSELSVRDDDQKHYISDLDEKYMLATAELEKKKTILQRCLEEKNVMRNKIKEMKDTGNINKDQAKAPNQEDQIINLQTRLQEMQNICKYMEVNPEQARKLCSVNNPALVNN